MKIKIITAVLFLTTISCSNLQLFKKSKEENTNKGEEMIVEDRKQKNTQLLDSYHSELIELINPKLLVHLRDLKDNSLLLLIFIEPQQIKEIVILEYTVKCINKLNNKELVNVEFNSDLSKRLLVEVKDLQHNTPYKICIEAKLELSCNNSSSVENLDMFVNVHSLLSQYCRILNEINFTSNNTKTATVKRFEAIIISSCIDNVVTQKSISLQALTSSLGALIALISIMSCIYAVQTCKTGQNIKIGCRKSFDEDTI